MTANVAALLYLAAGILFILALRGLSSPATSRQGNLYGMLGMTIAVLTTLGQITTIESPATWGLIAAGLGIGGFIGGRTARRSSSFQSRNIPRRGSPIPRAACCRRARENCLLR